MVDFNKILWLDTETSGLDPKISNILELAWKLEVNKSTSDMRCIKVQPILHCEDKLYGSLGDVKSFCDSYNSKMHEKDPDQLVPFSFPGGSPLFIYAKSALTFNRTPPDIANPEDWLLGAGVTPAKQALLTLIEDLGDTKGRWILAGHNVSFDYTMLYWWSRRLLGQESALLMDKLNKYVFLDTLDLTRWMQYSGRLSIKEAKLSEVASTLGMDVSKAHSADSDVDFAQKAAKILLNMEKKDKAN
jgi:DNA polymerase III epsilon subunit-like protein